jgi:hypothetical protein
MIDRLYMTKERFDEALANGEMTHKTYEDYVASVDKLYDELDQVTDEDIYEDQ